MMSQQLTGQGGTKRSQEHIHQCNDCLACFSGTGCIYRVRAHEEITGHTVRKIGQ